MPDFALQVHLFYVMLSSVYFLLNSPVTLVGETQKHDSEDPRGREVREDA